MYVPQDPPTFTPAEERLLAGAHPYGWGGLTFYLAGPYGRRTELLACREDLVARGHRVPCRWLHGDHQVHGPEANKVIEAGGIPDEQLSATFAVDDLEDLDRADVIVSFTEPPGGAPRGGRHVEFGYALGQHRHGGRYHLAVVGHVENIFHALDGVTYHPTWQEFLAVLDGFPDHCGRTRWTTSSTSPGAPEFLVGPCPLHPLHVYGPLDHSLCVSPRERTDP